jgi:hypothetical protein
VPGFLSYVLKIYFDEQIPVEEPDNPYMDVTFESPTVEQYTLSKTFRGHTNAVSALAFHPKK